MNKRHTGGIGDAPIEPQLIELMNGLAVGIDEVLNDGADPPRTGFILLVFPFDGHEGRCNYIAKARREDVIVLLKEQLARFEGMAEGQGTA